MEFTEKASRLRASMTEQVILADSAASELTEKFVLNQEAGAIIRCLREAVLISANEQDEALSAFPLRKEEQGDLMYRAVVSGVSALALSSVLKSLSEASDVLHAAEPNQGGENT